MISEKMKNSDFHKFFVDELKDLYWAENALLKDLPKMQAAATSEELAKGFEKHAEETKQHISRLEKVFESLGEKAEGVKCEAMEGILKEGRSIIEDTAKDTMIRDAGLVLAAQKVEHYEIATYGTLKVFASHMGHREAERLLAETLDNEKATNGYLTGLAERFINAKAVAE
ncbi:ferritin-like metal-binding protein YciE [Chryseobacterium sp. MP_3.2]|nr:ferritin-like metal-binding protein YciE [Chryseobacterium sp. MP_3.2]